MNSKIIIIGGKGIACVVAEQIIHAISNFGLKDEILGFAFKDETMDNVLGYPIVSRDYFELAKKYEKYDDVKCVEVINGQSCVLYYSLGTN